MSHIRDIQLKAEGHQRIAWVARHMPVLNAIGDRFEREKPFAGRKIALSIHLEAKTAYLVKTLVRGGAELFVTGSNRLSTQDAVCAALVDDGITVNAIHGASEEETVALWKETLSCHPDIVIDDGSDLINLLLGDCKACADRIIGLDRLKAIHLNDSMNPLGARKDRHAKIGEGHIGTAALSAVTRHPLLRGLPICLETPNDLSGYAAEIALLRSLDAD